MGRKINWEFGVNRYVLLYIKWINNKDLLYSIGNYVRYLLITYYGEEYEKDIYIYINLLYTWNIVNNHNLKKKNYSLIFQHS